MCSCSACSSSADFRVRFNLPRLTSLSYAEIPQNLMSRATSFSALAQQFAQSFGVGLTALVVHFSMVTTRSFVIGRCRSHARLLGHRRGFAAVDDPIFPAPRAGRCGHGRARRRERKGIAAIAGTKRRVEGVPNRPLLQMPSSVDVNGLLPADIEGGERRHVHDVGILSRERYELHRLVETDDQRSDHGRAAELLQQFRSDRRRNGRPA